MLKPGLYPFWFWNDRLQADELRWQVQQMAAQGFAGFYLHSRQGLGVPYLSDAFMDLVEVVILEAERLGMTVHLYDEYPYPSGVAGGQVGLGDPELRATCLTPFSADVDGGAVRLRIPAGKVLDCAAYPVRDGQVVWGERVELGSAVGPVLEDESFVDMGLTMYNRKRYFASGPSMIVEATLPAGRWRVTASVQQMVTGHKYWGHFADVLNPAAVQRWIELTHERYFARFGERFGTTIPSIFVDETAPHWSGCLPGLYAQAYGEALEPLLPALNDASHPRHVELSKRYYDLRLSRFMDTFERPMASWCEAHGIRYGGEKPSMRLSQLRFMALPGADPGHTKAGARPDVMRVLHRSNGRAIASAAYWYGREGALCECYHSLGWSGTIQDAKLVAELLLLMGVRYLVPHGVFYSTHALRKHDAPPSFFFQMPYWPLFGRMSRRLDRIFEAFEGTHIAARVLVVDPHPGMPDKADLDELQRLYDTLMAAHVEFLVVDVDVLKEAREEGGALRLRDLSVDLVVVPPMQTPEPALTSWLAANSGRVLHWETGSTAESLTSRARPSLRVSPLEGDCDPLWICAREGGGTKAWFVVNPSNDRVRVRFEAPVPLSEAELDEPVAEPVDASGCRTIEPYESLLLTAGRAGGAGRPPEVIRIELDGAMSVRPLQANVVRLDTWSMRLPGHGNEAATVSSLPLANQLAESGLAVRPRVGSGFGVMPTLNLPELTVEYSTGFECEAGLAVELVVEPDSLVGEWTVLVNGKAELAAGDLRPTASHVRGSLGVDLTPHLVAGANELTVRVVTDRLDGGLRNPLYLAGAFAVKAAPLQLSAPLSEGRFEAYETNGLPFYAGTIEYAFEQEWASLPDGEAAWVELGLPVTCQEACEVSLNGGPYHPVLWQPRRFRVPMAELREGVNQVVVRVHTSLVRAFEGEWFDPVAHRYRSVGE